MRDVADAVSSKRDVVLGKAATSCPAILSIWGPDHRVAVLGMERDERMDLS